MTADQALSIAVEALHYALENDSDYLSDETVAEWEEAARVLAAPPPDDD
jgi:hypothetical protein